MNDRLKFRVWDKENKCLHYPTRYSNYSIVNGTVVKIESYPTANSAYLGKRIAWEFDDAVIMQCTGSKDKNGKLIYEGDVVRTYPSGFFDAYTDTFFIKYNLCGFYLATPYKKMSGDWESQDTIGCYNKEIYEVIGNIYEDSHLIETPELLKGKGNERQIKV